MTVTTFFVINCLKFVKKAFIGFPLLYIMEDREEIMLNALNHKVRREILRLIKNKESVTYTHILNRTELPTCWGSGHLWGTLCTLREHPLQLRSS